VRRPRLISSKRSSDVLGHEVLDPLRVGPELLNVAHHPGPGRRRVHGDPARSRPARGPREPDLAGIGTYPPRMNPGLDAIVRERRACRQSRDARRRRRSAADADELGVALCDQLGYDAGPDSTVTKVLADRLTHDGQQALRRCRSHSPNGHQPKPADLFPDGRNAEGI
jgi:hypothetical protein